MLLARGADGIVLLIALAFGSLIVLLGWLLNDGSFRFAGQRWRTQEEFLDLFGSLVGLQGRATGGIAGPTGAIFDGEPHGVGTTLSFSYQRSGKHRFLRGTVTSRVRDIPTLVVKREGLFTPVGKFFGVTNDHDVGDPEFDAKFILDTHDPRAVKALANEELRRRIDAVFERPLVQGLVLANGSVRVSIDRCSEYASKNWKGLVLDVAAVARCFERTPVKVHVLGRERRAFRGKGDHWRCAYCHEDVTGAEPDLVACDHCATVVHDACWSELGRCPVIGCDGSSRERGAERA